MHLAQLIQLLFSEASSKMVLIGARKEDILKEGEKKP